MRCSVKVTMNNRCQGGLGYVGEIEQHTEQSLLHLFLQTVNQTGVYKTSYKCKRQALVFLLLLTHIHLAAKTQVAAPQSHDDYSFFQISLFHALVKYAFPSPPPCINKTYLSINYYTRMHRISNFTRL